MNWEIDLGETRRRREIHALYGGQLQGGIATPQSSKNILIFTDPVSGAAFGYEKYEGLLPDGTYRYTGQGQVGDQQFIRLNKRILESPQTGHIIRLFLAKSPYATYVGSFTLSDPAYERKPAPDRNGLMRQVIVFNLTPLEATLDNLPKFDVGNIDPSEPEKPWVAPNWESYVAIRKSRGDLESEVTRLEHKLQSEFGLWLESQGHRLVDKHLDTGSTRIFPDLFDASTMTVYEAKRSAGRGYVRTAIGQVLDYQHVAEINGLTVDCGILLPGRPEEDMLTLCKKLNIRVFRPGNAELGEPKFFEAVSPT